YDTLIAGAGYAGSIMAERLATECGQSVLVIDRRDHIAGNAYDYVDDHGVLVHAYGPHIFHTHAERVVEYLSRFTDWRAYEHRAEPVGLVKTSEDAVVSKVGRDLYEKFFRGYTRKQWERDPSELHASVCARIPLRTNTDDRYFTDWHQAMPVDGYTRMFRRILDHPNIEVSLGTDYFEIQDELAYDHLVFTGPVDRFFDYRFGALPYRSLEWELVTEPSPDGGRV